MASSAGRRLKYHCLPQPTGLSSSRRWKKRMLSKFSVLKKEGCFEYKTHPSYRTKIWSLTSVFFSLSLSLSHLSFKLEGLIKVASRFIHIYGISEFSTNHVQPNWGRPCASSSLIFFSNHRTLVLRNVRYQRIRSTLCFQDSQKASKYVFSHSFSLTRASDPDKLPSIGRYSRRLLSVRTVLGTMMGAPPNSSARSWKLVSFSSKFNSKITLKNDAWQSIFLFLGVEISGESIFQH